MASSAAVRIASFRAAVVLFGVPFLRPPVFLPSAISDLSPPLMPTRSRNGFAPAGAGLLARTKGRWRYPGAFVPLVIRPRRRSAVGDEAPFLDFGEDCDLRFGRFRA